jgi:hypothetical protein
VKTEDGIYIEMVKMGYIEMVKMGFEKKKKRV